MPIDDFNKTIIAPLLDKINKEDKRLVLLGDFNINLLDLEKREINSFIDILQSNLITPSITLPTRITDHSSTLIDNIFISPFSTKLYSGNLVIGISDHMPPDPHYLK